MKNIKEDLVLHRAPKKHAIPFSFQENGHEYGGNIDHEIRSEYLAEYKSQPRAFKENLTLPEFIQLKEERRPCSNRRKKGNRFLLSTFDGPSSCTQRLWERSCMHFFSTSSSRERGC